MIFSNLLCPTQRDICLLKLGTSKKEIPGGDLSDVTVACLILPLSAFKKGCSLISVALSALICRVLIFLAFFFP